MKKLIILLVLFLISVAVAVGLTVTEQNRRTKDTGTVKTQGQDSQTSAGSSLEKSAAPTLPPYSKEGNIALVISNPPNNITTKESSVTVSGKTTPSATVMVNEYEMTAGKDGSFSKIVSLDDGENYISVVAYTANGDVAEQELKITKEVEGY